MDVTAPVTTIPGVGSIMAGKLERLAIRTVFDFLYHLPFRYEDRSLISDIARIQVGEIVTVVGTLTELKNIFSKRGKPMQIGKIKDGSGSIGVMWFNQTYLLKALKIGETYSFYGKADFFSKKVYLMSPEHEQGSLHTGRIVAIYPETAGLSSKWFRGKVQDLLSELPYHDFLPPKFHQQLWKDALQTVHFPESLETVEEARHRLAFDELFLLQLAALVHREKWMKTKLAHNLTIHQNEIDRFIASLPFQLTASQHRAINESLSDLSRTQPMNRLLEGDVGSGKTIVAATAALATHLSGFQTLILTPTQILAQQHYQSFQKLFSPLGIEVGLVTGNVKRFSTTTPIVVGTHALLSEKSRFEKVALVVVDEQHRFGVAQRALAATKGQTPHMLTMTATPIPRTIALTLYGDLDLSQLTELPSGRLPVKTWVVPESKRGSSHLWIAEQLKTGNQCFWVCPFINESESMQTVKAASVEFERLKQIFKTFKLGLVHGKLKAAEKDEVLRQFRAGEVDILVATPVVEVGIDIPKASVMVIEGADRFGLAQLHQLRGRVGRNNQQAYCLLFAENQTSRLKAMENHHLGVELAQLDMELRGPGDVYGTAQHGVPGFKVANYSDVALIEQARAAAKEALQELPTLPHLRLLVEKDKIGLVQPN